MKEPAKKSQTKSGAGAAIQCASFYVDDALLGIPIQQIDEINRHVDFTPVPHAPPHVRGVINLRGEVVTVLDLRTILHGKPTEITRFTRNVVLSINGERAGLLVDRVADVVAVSGDQVEPPPANARGAAGRYFQGLFKMERELLVILDVPSVLAGDAVMA